MRDSSSPDSGSDSAAVYRDRFRRLVAFAVFSFDLRPEIAAELVQDVFLKFSTGNYAVEYPPAWLKKAVVRRCLEFRERELRERTGLGLQVPLVESCCADPTPETESRLLLDQALSHLKEKPRLALRLHHIEGFSAREVASILQTTPGYARQLIFEGMLHLSKVLQANRKKGS